ncbi:hypothetical protein L195_g034530 [Trifolium pratense]|uniref:Uncharacterized protein n=1 Tax=Trifolium pratense TaxID=57577 RepID=A0A2K3LJ52_TRIPR|nr:hypothetical protein L195_g034530 [Trifolium pratense]
MVSIFHDWRITDVDGVASTYYEGSHQVILQRKKQMKREKKQRNLDLGKDVVEEGGTIMKIDKRRGFATMVRMTLIRIN